MNMKKITGFYVLVLSLMLTLACCAPTIALYDQHSYQETTALKVDALSLMDLAAESYRDHLNEISALETKVNKAYEYEKHRPKNELTVKMWENFIQKWKNENTIRPAVIDGAKKNVGNAFDQIIQLEVEKIKKKL
jgi:hypothetical protein